MKINYTCYGSGGLEQPSWEGTLTPLRLTNPYEAEVSARGSSFHLVAGTHKYGNYLCIPNWNIGTELAALSDRFWNYEKLSEFTDLSDVDAYSVAYALAALSKLVK